jgi:hypothetical protein
MVLMTLFVPEAIKEFHPAFDGECGNPEAVRTRAEEPRDQFVEPVPV